MGSYRLSGFDECKQGFAIVTWYGAFYRAPAVTCAGIQVINQRRGTFEDFVMNALRSGVNEPFLLVSG